MKKNKKLSGEIYKPKLMERLVTFIDERRRCQFIPK